MRRVYLAGPIAGLTYQKAGFWREKAAAQLRREGYGVFNPLVGVKPWEGVLTGTTLEQDSLTAPRGIAAQTFFYVTRSDALLVNLGDTKKVSIGTVIEIAWAHQARIPVVAVLDSIHEHALLLELIDFRVGTIWEAIDVLTRVLHA